MTRPSNEAPMIRASVAFSLGGSCFREVVMEPLLWKNKKECYFKNPFAYCVTETLFSCAFSD